MAANVAAAAGLREGQPFSEWNQARTPGVQFGSQYGGQDPASRAHTGSVDHFRDQHPPEKPSVSQEGTSLKAEDSSEEQRVTAEKSLRVLQAGGTTQGSGPQSRSDSYQQSTASSTSKPQDRQSGQSAERVSHGGPTAAVLASDAKSKLSEEIDRTRESRADSCGQASVKGSSQDSQGDC